MNEVSNPSGQMKDFFDHLPTPPKEKVIRGVWYGGVSIAGLAGFLYLMPYLNHALSLGLEGVSLIIRLGAIILLAAMATYIVTSMWEPFKRKVESMARQTTISIFGDDPITPLKMWLAEVRQDCEGIERSANDIDGIIAENEKVVADNTAFQEDADKRFGAAVKKYGENSAQARGASIDAKGFKTRAENAIRINGPLKELYRMLFQIAEATRLGEREAEMSIGTAEMEWRAALKAETAMGNAQRSLNRRSARYVNATMAFDIIRQKYAGSFGQLRSLRRLSEETISKVDLNGEVAHDEALDRLREQSQKLLGYTPALPVPAFGASGAGEPVRISGSSAADLNLFDKQ